MGADEGDGGASMQWEESERVNDLSGKVSVGVLGRDSGTEKIRGRLRLKLRPTGLL